MVVTATATLTNPFPGLRPFRLDQEHLFFGREGQVDALLSRLNQTRFLAIVGTSGSGKSSLVRAGLLPALYSGFLSEAGSSWRVATLRPGNAPMSHLAQALNQDDVLGSLGEDAAIRAKFTEVTLRRGALGLVEVVRQARMASHESLLIVVDQFEELFRFKHSTQSTVEDEAAAFVKLLLSAVSQTSVPIFVVLTMRSDFLGDCAQFRGLPEAINQGQYLIPRMTREERQAAIEGPVAVGRATITPRLVNRLLNDMGDDPDQLPILQHALMRTWEEWQAYHRGDDPIDLVHYEASGGMADALSIHADELFHCLGDEYAKDIAERLFKSLTDKGPDNREVRRPTPLGEIASVCEIAIDDLVPIVEMFRQSGASFLMPPAGEVLTADTVLDISHESLMRVWGRLRQWVKEEQQSAEIYQRLADVAERYQVNKAALYRGPELTEALSWRQRTHPNQTWAQRYAVNYDDSIDFLNKSIAARQRERWKRRFLAISLVGVSLVAMVGGTLAWIEGKRATAERDMALNAEIEARNLTADHAFKSGRHVDAMLESLRIATIHQQLQHDFNPAIQLQSMATLHRNVFSPRPEVKGKGQETPTFRERNSLDEHSASVWSVSFSPDGELLASASDDRTVKLWNRNGQYLKTLEGHNSWVWAVSFSPDSQMIASASDDRTVKIWNREGKLLRTLSGHENSVWSVSFSPDGRMLATTSDDRTVKIWRIDGTLLRTLEGHQDAVWGVSFSPDGQTLASASYDQTVKLWSLEGQLLKTFEGHSDAVRSVSFSPDGEAIASASDDRTIKLWTKEGTLLTTLEGHRDTVRSITFSPDGQRLASASEDRSIKLWSRDGQALKTLDGHQDAVWSVSFSPDGQQLASSSYDRTIKLWQRNDQFLQRFNGHQAAVESVAVSLDGEAIASASQDHTVKLWSRGGKLLKTFAGHAGPVHSVSFSPDSRVLVSASADTTVRLWSRDGQLIQTLDGHGGPVRNVRFSPNGQWIASASDDHTVKIWSRDGKLIRTLDGHEDAVTSISFTPDSQTLASASADHTVKLWHRNGKLLKTLNKHHDSVESVSFSPDGERLASASTDKTVKLWTPDGKFLSTLEGHEAAVMSVRFSPDSQAIASGSLDRTVKLWTLDGQQLQSLPGNSIEVRSVHFSPDGTMLVSGGNDMVINAWRFEHQTLIDLGCAWLNDFLINHPETLLEIQVCHTEPRLQNAAVVLTTHAKHLSEQGHIEESKRLLKLARKWHSMID